ncbi:glycosyl hydrolase [Halalkalicoccus tibetensis]|uniref:Glycosyl hydrolase n=1 Tax=Halalkalicoccus tibetensis TaxID=175632 RepID=A0ABD5V4B8_9EURY
MDRRQFIGRSAAVACSGVALAGCTGEEGSEGVEGTEGESGGPADDGAEEEQGSEPEPEGGDGEPFYHYDLDVHEERANGQPVWIDRDERLYGRDGLDVIVSDDWWETTEILYSFGDEEGRVETVIVPDSGNVIVAVGGRDDVGGRVYRLADDLDDHELLYQFDYGRVSNSMGHAVHEDVVVISCYGMSDFENDRHPNEVILSTDGGGSFEQVLEVPLETEDAANHHVHDVEYDPYAERIWVAHGDHGNSQLFWSDDHGDSWEEIDEQGAITMVTQVAAFEDCVVLGTDGTPEGIMRWERESPEDTPDRASDFERVHVQIQLDPDDDTMEVYARRRWHVREDDGRELCLMPFGYSPMHDTAEDSVLLASVDGDEWYELLRTETRDILLTNVMGPLSMDGDLRTLVSDSNQGDGHQFDATIPRFWD